MRRALLEALFHALLVVAATSLSVAHANAGDVLFAIGWGLIAFANLLLLTFKAASR